MLKMIHSLLTVRSQLYLCTHIFKYFHCYERIEFIVLCNEYALSIKCIIEFSRSFISRCFLL